jgi:hypothetical protein
MKKAITSSETMIINIERNAIMATLRGTRTFIVGLVVLMLVTNSVWAQPLTRIDFSLQAINIDFDLFPDGSSVPNNTPITTQYENWGVLFSSLSTPQTSSNYQSSYGSLASPPNVLLAGGSEITLNFMHPVSGMPVPISAVGADIIFRDTSDVTTLEVFDAFGYSLGFTTTPPDGGAGDEVFIGFADPRIHKAVFSFDTSDRTVGLDNLIFEPISELIDVDLDIKPGSDRNPVNLKSKGQLPVVVFGSEELDVSTIDLATLLLNGVALPEKNNGKLFASFDDEDDDGFLDLIMHFALQDLGIEAGMEELLISGSFLDGSEFEGSDLINIVPTGDANGDGVVSAADYAVVQANFGEVGDLGDANFDGAISAADYAAVQASFGASAGAAEVTPEPATITFLVIGGLALIRRKRK